MSRPQLVLMPQLAEATSKVDDWTGIRDAAARRRAQTRLSTRAYRRRKGKAQAKNAGPSNTTTGAALVESETLVECWDVKQESVCIIPQSYVTKRPLLRLAPSEGGSNLVFPLCPDHLITLLQFNVLRALALNRTLISGILTTPLDCGVEEFIHVVPYPTEPQSLPSALLPTTLQQTIPHSDWIDMFPCPEARDRLILTAGTFDEDELWDDCSGGLYEGCAADEVTRRGMIAWSPSWDMTGWEMSEGFLKKWGWLFVGVPGALEATNRWRRKRGEHPLVYDGCTGHVTV
ncbi:hypothetical protein PG984_015598 [Apiospora sp. TS-2023a]